MPSIIIKNLFVQILLLSENLLFVSSYNIKSNINMIILSSKEKERVLKVINVKPTNSHMMFFQIFINTVSIIHLRYYDIFFNQAANLMLI